MGIKVSISENPSINEIAKLIYEHIGELDYYDLESQFMVPTKKWKR